MASFKLEKNTIASWEYAVNTHYVLVFFFFSFSVFLKMEPLETPDILKKLFCGSKLPISFSALTVSTSKTNKHDFAKDAYCYLK